MTSLTIGIVVVLSALWVAMTHRTFVDTYGTTLVP